VIAAVSAVFDVLGVFALESESPLLGLLETGLMASGLIWVEVVSMHLLFSSRKSRVSA
jgi:hypothetical protein